MLDSFRRDVRHALRVLRRSPGFAAVAAGTLALAIGGTTVMFAMADAVLWQPLPFRDPARLVLVHEMRLETRIPTYASLSNYADWRRDSRSFEGMAAYTDAGFVLTGRGEPQRLQATQVSASAFAVIGVQPALGRSILPEEDRPGGTRVVVLSDYTWRQRFDADPTIVGRSIMLDSHPYVIVGVMPPGFQLPIGPDPIDVYTPIGWDTFPLMRVRDGRLVRVVGRLRPLATVGQAQVEMTALTERLAAAYPDTNAGWGAMVVPMREDLAGGIRNAMVMLLGAVGFVLVIACVNLANLSLARAAARRGEFAIRAALGAGTSRLAGQVITESLVVASLGGAAALLLFSWLRDLVLAVAPATIPRVTDASLNGRTLVFVAFATTIAGLLLAIGSLTFATNRDTVRAVRQERGAGGKASGNRVRSALLVAQVSLAIVLVTGAGLLTRSMLRLLAVDPGFNPSGVSLAHLNLSLDGYPTSDRRRAFFDGVLERLGEAPGVQAAATAFPTVIGSRVTFPIEIEGRPVTPVPTGAFYRSVSASYFDVLGIPLLRGRLFSDGDRPGTVPVAIVNETMAARFWPGEDPVGKRFTIVDRNDGDRRTLREIVGVVPDVRHRSLDTASGPEMYVPFRQAPSLWMAVFVRTDAHVDVVRTIASAVRTVDPAVPVERVQRLSDRVASSVAPRRFSVVLLGAFAAVAMALTMLGVWGLTAYGVTQRVQEIGVRIALGASRTHVLMLLLGGTVRLTLAGTLFGLLGAVWLTQVLSTMLFDVSALDLPTFALAAIALPVLSAIAALMPSLRALRIDPIVALRTE